MKKMLKIFVFVPYINFSFDYKIKAFGRCMCFIYVCKNITYIIEIRLIRVREHKYIRRMGNTCSIFDMLHLFQIYIIRYTICRKIAYYGGIENDINIINNHLDSIMVCYNDEIANRFDHTSSYCTE